MMKILFLQLAVFLLLAHTPGVGPLLHAAPAVIQGGLRLGGGAHDEAHAAAFDSRGNLLVVGSTSSADFPVTIGEAFQEAPAGDLDAYVASFDPEGSLRFATYFGGSAEERGLAIALDAEDNIVIAGLTISADLEVTNDSTLSGFHGDRATADGFLAVLSADASRLLFATYLGGASFDVANSLAMERDGRILVSGITQSASFPTTAGALQERYGGGVNDGFIARLDPSAGDARAQQLSYSTFLGGSGIEGSGSAMPNDSYEYALGLGRLLLDMEGHVIIAGMTGSPDFPVPAGAAPLRVSGRQDALVAKLNLDPALSPGDQVMLVATVGGPGQESTFDASLGPDGTVWLAGHTWSRSFPVTADAYQRTPAGSDWADAFLVQVSLDSGEILYSTLLGGSDFDNFFAVRTDAAGGVAAVGRTFSTDLRITDNAPNRSLSSWEDALIAYLAPDRTMALATYAGGGGEEELLGLARAPDGRDHAVGWTNSPSFEGLDSQALGGVDALVAGLKLRFPRAAFSVTPAAGPAPLAVVLDAGASTTPAGTMLDASSFVWDFGDEITGVGRQVEHTFTAPGRYVVKLTVTNDVGLEAVAKQIVLVGCPPGPLGDWSAADVGEPGIPGAAHLDGDVLGLCAGGSRLTGRADRFHFVHRELACGDFTLTAQVQAAATERASAQVALMLREGLEANARHVAVVIELLITASQARLISRSAPDGGTTGGTVRLPLVPPDAWLRLTRRGDAITAAVSADGVTWDETSFAPVALEGLTPAVHLGFAGMGAEPADPAAAFVPLQATFAAIRLEERCLDRVVFRRGDCNDDGAVDISDAVCILNWLFLGGETPACVAVTNTNGDAGEDISDAVYLLTHLFLGGPAPVAPFPGCGPGTLPTDEEACVTPPKHCQQ